MPVYSSLSQTRANEILTLADDSFNAHMEDASPEGTQYRPGEALERLLQEPKPERKALLQALDNLNHSEANDLISIMYVGRGDYVEDDEDPVSVKAAFDIHHEDFSRQTAKELVAACAEKDMAFHIYLRRGLRLLS